MIQGAPQDVQKDPQGYYYWLVSNGFPHEVAYNEMIKEFGPPKSKEQIAKEQSDAQQKGAMAQVGGTVGGAAATGWAMNGFQTPSWMKSTPKPTDAPNASGAAANAGAANAGGSNLGNIDTSFNYQTPEFKYNGGKAPEIISNNGETAVVKLENGTTAKLPSEAVNEPGFMESANWSAIGSGAMSALAAYQAYKSYKSGDKIGAGISGATSVSMGAAAANSAGMSFAGSETAAAAAPYLGAAAGAYQGYQTAKMIGDSPSGTKRNQQGAIGGATSGALIGGSIGSVVPGVGTAIGAVVGGVVGAAAGLVGSWTGSHKGKAQFMRDNIRKVMQEGGILDENWQGTLADGSKYDFGKDGKSMKWSEIDKISSAQPKAWNGAVPLADAMAAAYGFVGQKASDIAAWYAKGAVSNAGDNADIAKQNMQHFAQQQGITYDMVKGKLDEAMKDNRISQSQYDYYLGGAQQLVGGPANGASGQQKPVQRPKAGQVARVSPGMYMNDQGKITKAKTVREALNINYNKTKGNKNGK